MNLQKLNLELAAALGIHDAKDVCKVVMTLTPDAAPRIEVTRYLRTADGLQTAVEMLRLAPKEDA